MYLKFKRKYIIRELVNFTHNPNTPKSVFYMFFLHHQLESYHAVENHDKNEIPIIPVLGSSQYSSVV